MNQVRQEQRCRILGCDEGQNQSERLVLDLVARAFNEAGVTILCEPSIVGASVGRPDIAIIDPTSGLHVVEVKGVTLDQVNSLLPGGAIEIRYNSGSTRTDPSLQAERHMFAAKDAASRRFGGDLNACFEFWVVFPRIDREDWERKFGDGVSSRKEVLFRNDLESAVALASRLRSTGQLQLHKAGLSQCPAAQVECLLAAFGDSAALAPPPRALVEIPAGGRGQWLAEKFAAFRVLSPEQQRLASQSWNGPRLIRGVAGSGKTVVLATQAARLAERLIGQGRNLFDDDGSKRILAVCFNRTLVPFLRERVAAAFEQRTGMRIPDNLLVVESINRLCYRLATEGLLNYRRVGNGQDAGERARAYLVELEAAKGRSPEHFRSRMFHTVMVDEGQDFHEDEYRLLLALCGRGPDGPRMAVFYDDAQNLYGRTRPTWSALGLDVKGRAVVMERSFRSTREIVEPPFNVLLGAHSTNPSSVKTRGFADLSTLLEKQLVSPVGDHFVVGFADRPGERIRWLKADSRDHETLTVVRHVDELIHREGLLPQDILVLTLRQKRATELADALRVQLKAIPVRIACSEDEKDSLVMQPGSVTVSTVASAKGYDAPLVILASANEFQDDVSGRASLYVGCTRAREWLFVFRYGDSVLMSELQLAIDAARSEECQRVAESLMRRSPPPA